MSTERYRERMMRQKRTDILAEIGREVFGKEVSPVDFSKRYLLKAAPFVIESLYPNAWEHFNLVSIYEGELAKKLNLNVGLHEAVGLTHDQGRWITNYYYQTNLAGEHLSRKANFGFNGFDIVGPILGLRTFEHKKGQTVRVVNRVDDLSTDEIIHDVADNLGRLDATGKQLITIEEWKTYVGGQMTRYTRESPYASENAGIEAYKDIDLKGKGRGRVAVQLLLDEVEYLQKKGINFEEIRGSVGQKFFDPETQEFVLKLKNAQETLDPQIDKKIGRGKINTVIFDIGGVLLNVSDESLIKGISRNLGVDKERVKQAFAILNKEAMAGKIDGITYLQSFGEIVGKTNISPQDFVLPEIYNPMDGMQEIVWGLYSKKINIWVYSDIIPLLTGVTFKKIRQYYPEISQKDILFSCDIKSPKRDKSSFENVASRVNGKNILFIDDVESYTTNARVSGMRSITFRGNPFRNVSPVQRLKQELLISGLI